MKIISITFSQVICFVKAGDVSEKVPDMAFHLVRTITEKYKFWESPHKIADYNLQNGIHFLNGYFGTEKIDKFAVFNDGFLVEGKVSTDVLESFVGDVLSLITKETGFKIERGSAPTVFLSNLEVTTDVDMASTFERFAVVGDVISKTLNGYGHSTPKFRVSLIGFHGDVWNGLGGYRPSPFSFDRRAGNAYEKNLYFSSAPLKTGDHLRVLELLEKLLVA